jgi:hypothetical protein
VEVTVVVLKVVEVVEVVVVAMHSPCIHHNPSQRRWQRAWQLAHSTEQHHFFPQCKFETNKQEKERVRQQQRALSFLQHTSSRL